ncbi:MAG: purine-binding chemotaxis protein CheW [Phycisphaerae bacterium]|nr:purine-binding chemotaxis protein CheW [Phycisphaerae bacterium]
MSSKKGDVSGKYLTFCLDDEEFGLEILKVREIIGLMPITSVPQTPSYVEGVINLRGKVIPVLDLRLKFGIPGAERTEETCIIVVQVGAMEIGAIVDRVSEVRDIYADDIDPPPNFGMNVDSDFIIGMGKSDGGKVTMLLDIDRVLSGDSSMLMGMESEETDAELADASF